MKAVMIAVVLLSLLFFSHSGAAPVTAPLLVTTGADDGPGSLCAAIRDAAPQSTIEFMFAGVISLSSGELLPDKNLTIAGPGAAIVTIRGQAFEYLSQFNRDGRALRPDPVRWTSNRCGRRSDS